MTSRERRRLERRRSSLVRKLANVDEFVRGSVVLMKRRCTYPGCRKCAAGERHPTWVLTVSRRGKTQTVYLGERRLARARRMVESYRTLRALIQEIADINLALLTDRPLPTKGPPDDAKRQAP